LRAPRKIFLASLLISCSSSEEEFENVFANQQSWTLNKVKKTQQFGDIVRGLVFRNNNILVGHRCRGRYLTTVVYLGQRSIKYIGYTENDIESNKI
jgi:hypothetical protein